MKHLSFALGLVILSIGLSSAAGYIIGFSRLYTWDGGIGMAVNTAIALTLTGFAITIISHRQAIRGCYDQKPPIEDEPTTII